MKMNKLALAIGALVMAGGAMAQSTATGTGTANATVVAPISITAGAALEFGNIISTSHTVMIPTSGSRVITGATNTNAAGTVNAATFTVNGAPNFTYTIALPASASINTTPAGTAMTVNAFTVAGGTNGSVTTGIGTLSAGGVGNLNVGATLTVNALQPVGSYAGSYSVTVAYN